MWQKEAHKKTDKANFARCVHHAHAQFMQLPLQTNIPIIDIAILPMWWSLHNVDGVHTHPLV